MKYETENEFENFDFRETYIKDLEPGNGYFHIWLDNVKIYDADGKPKGERPDETILPENYGEIFPLFLEGCVYSIEKEENGTYIFIVDSKEGDTYEMKITGNGEKEKWEKFLSMDSM